MNTKMTTGGGFFSPLTATITTGAIDTTLDTTLGVATKLPSSYYAADTSINTIEPHSQKIEALTDEIKDLKETIKSLEKRVADIEDKRFELDE
jgi:peptidoglycan hydrolase CwlO-like protein